MATEILAVKYDAFVVPPGVDTTALVPFVFNGLVVLPLNTVTNASGLNNVLVYRSPRIRVPKVAAQVWTAGDKIYWDNTAKNFTKTTTSNTLCGRVAASALSADTQGLIDLDPAQA